MLLFSYKLEKYIKNVIFPKVLLIPDKYIIKGSFKRRVPYITDIDVVNIVYPEINKSNIYENILNLVRKLNTKEYDDIILVYLICGRDDRFFIESGSDAEINRIRNILNKEEQEQLDYILEKYSDDKNKMIFYLNEFIWDFYKIIWTPKDILENKKILKGNLEITFKEIVEKNSTLLLQYYVNIGSYPIGIDVVVNYEPYDTKSKYQMAADYQIKLANYGEEYYFLLFPLKFYFKNNKKISQELENLIEKKFGLYKQLLVRIDTYDMLYKTGNLNIKTATGIINSILKDLKQLPRFKSDVPDLIRNISINNTPDYKMQQWHNLLDKLYDDIINTVNELSKEYFFRYLDMLPENLRKKYYFNYEKN